METNDEQIHNLKTELADYNASLQGWKASYEGEKERHQKTIKEFEKLKIVANGYIDKINELEILVIELRKGIETALRLA